MNKTIKAIEKKLDGVLLVNLISVLSQIDIQIAAARKAAYITNDFSELWSMNSVRIALLNKIEEQDADFHTNYVSERVGA